MKVLDAGGRPAVLRFLPDGRLLAGAGGVYDVWSAADGRRVRLDVPVGSAAAVTPCGAYCWFAGGWRVTVYRSADGALLPGPGGVFGTQVAISPDGERVYLADLSKTPGTLTVVTAEVVLATVLAERRLPASFRLLAGVIAGPDGDRLVTVSDRVRVGTVFKEEAATKYPSRRATRGAVSPDGRTLGVAGSTSLYLYDLPGLGPSRQIAAEGNPRGFQSFAFHPDGKTVAVINGGPTLVKFYDLATLEPTGTFDWQLGPLTAVAFSPDGQLGAVAAEDGRILVWDVEG